jgi:hypothetical protein
MFWFSPGGKNSARNHEKRDIIVIRFNLCRSNMVRASCRLLLEVALIPFLFTRAIST